MTMEVRSARDIGRLIRESRDASGLSQVELARRLGISQRYLSELERGTPKILDDRYLRILSGIGITILAEVGSDD